MSETSMTLDQRVAFLDANPTMHASQRVLRAWQSLGPATKALADEPKGQGYIVGVERLNILADIAKAGTPEGREKRLGELLAQVVGLVLGAEGAA